MAFDSLVKRVNSWVEVSSGIFARRVVVADPSTIFDASDATRADDDSVTLTATGDDSDLIAQRSKTNGDVAFVISGLTTETVTLKSFIDAGQTVETAALRPFDASTGVVVGASALGNGSYVMRDMPGYFWHFEKSGAVDTPTIAYMDA